MAYEGAWLRRPTRGKHLPVLAEGAKLKPNTPCTRCGAFVKDRYHSFRNRVSREEYQLSGMCQECQDAVYGKD